MMSNHVAAPLALALALCGSPVVSAQATKVDSAIPGYSKTSGVSGNLSSVGSDTLNNLMTLWSETFRKFYPNVKVQIEGKGSSTAPPALIAGTAQIGPMSRPIFTSGTAILAATGRATRWSWRPRIFVRTKMQEPVSSTRPPAQSRAETPSGPVPKPPCNASPGRD